MVRFMLTISRTSWIKLLKKWIKTRSSPPSDEHTVQCFSANSARHSDCVSTADGVPSAVIRTGQTRAGQALDSRQDKARQERHRLVVE